IGMDGRGSGIYRVVAVRVTDGIVVAHVDHEKIGAVLRKFDDGWRYVALDVVEPVGVGRFPGRGASVGVEIPTVSQERKMGRCSIGYDVCRGAPRERDAAGQRGKDLRHDLFVRGVPRAGVLRVVVIVVGQWIQGVAPKDERGDPTGSSQAWSASGPEK